MSYMTNSPSRAPWLSSGEEALLKIYVIPAWIYRAFTAKYNLVEIHDYAKLRDVLSLVDVAHLELLRRQFMDLPEVKVGSDYFSGPLSLVFPNHGTGGQQPLTGLRAQEVNGTISYLINDPRTQQEALCRLRDIESKIEEGGEAIDAPLTHPVPDQPQSHYRVVLLHGALYIIVEEGFLTHLKGKVEHMAFLTEVLKSAYAVAPIKVVNRSVWYRQYVTALPA